MVWVSLPGSTQTQIHPMRLLPLAALAAVFASPALADIVPSHGWAQGFPGTNFATVHADLDTETGALSVWADYFGLEGDLLSVRISDPSGNEWGTLDHEGGRDGFMSGIVVADAARVDQLLTSGFFVRFHTAALPAGEMEAGMGFGAFHTFEFDIDSGQVILGGAPGAGGDVRIAILIDGRVGITGILSGIDFPITGLELRGPAWYGEEGPLMLDLAPLNLAGIPSGLNVQIAESLLTSAQRRDVRDGQCYLLVRTAAYPGGALRGQMYDHLRATSYCAARTSSVAFIGGQLVVSGSVRAADNDITLHGQFFPQGATVLPLVGVGTAHVFDVPGSRGTLCIGGGWIGRYVHSLAQGQGFGIFDVPIDLTQVPSSTGVFSAGAGDRLNFQLWYRDIVAGVPVSNFSNAVSVRLR